MDFEISLMHWVIQNKLREEEGIRALREGLPRWSIPHSFHDVIPIVGELIPDIDITGHAIVIGSYSMRHVARRKGWIPGCFDVGHLTHENYLNHWGPALLNASAVVCRFEDAPRYIMDEFFVRPTIDSKSFTGQPYLRADFLEWYEKVMALNDLNAFVLPDTEIIIAPIKQIQQEYRCWIVDGRVVTTSLYKRAGSALAYSLVDDRVVEYARGFAEGSWQPERAYCLDVCVCSDQLRIVEVNTMNAAGFYAADIFKLVEAIEDMQFPS